MNLELCDKITYLWGWDNREGVHDPVGILLTDLGDEEGSHAGAGATTQGVGQLEALKTVAALSLLAHHIKDRVYKLSTLCVVTFGPVVSSTRLSKDKVVWAEDLSEGSGADRVHGAWLQIDQNGTGHILATCGLIVVDVDPLQLKIRVTVVGASWVNAVLVRDDFPELSSNLVAALASLHVNDFPHGDVCGGIGYYCMVVGK